MTPAPAHERESLLLRTWWIWLSAVWVVIGLAFAAQTVFLGGFEWNAAIAWAVLDWGLWIPLAPLAVTLARRLHITATNWRWAVPTHILLSVVFAIAIEAGSVFALRMGWMPDPRPRPPAWREETGIATNASANADRPPAFEPGRSAPPEFSRDPQFGRPPGPRPPGGPRPFPMGTGRGRLALPIYFALVVGTHAVAYHRRSIERERRALLAEARLADARAMALQTQLQPHFFFNALNTVASLIYTQPEQAEETVCALGELMRSVLDASHRREIPLREELGFVDRYLAVQQIRFGPRLQIVRAVPEELLGGAVPTLLLQPLVENAVVHGVAPFPNPGTVTLRARRDDAQLVLQVINTCGELAAAAAAETLAFTPRVGLMNTRTRLEALYGSAFRLEHRRTLAGEVITEVVLPWKQLPT